VIREREQRYVEAHRLRAAAPGSLRMERFSQCDVERVRFEQQHDRVFDNRASANAVLVGNALETPQENGRNRVRNCRVRDFRHFYVAVTRGGERANTQIPKYYL